MCVDDLAAMSAGPYSAAGASPGTPSTFGQSNRGHDRGGGSTPFGAAKPGGLFGAGAFGAAAASKAAAAAGYASPGFGGGGGSGGGGIGGYPQARPPSSASGGVGGSFSRMDSVFGQTARGRGSLSSTSQLNLTCFFH
jgi:hypothetical protein